MNALEETMQAGFLDTGLEETQAEGCLDILNTGLGHLNLTFNKNDAEEKAQASRMITDMMKRGYAIFVHGKGDKLIRVKHFDPKECVYVVKGPEKEERLPATKVKATAIGRSAGG